MNKITSMTEVKAQGILDKNKLSVLHVDWQLLWACNYRCSYCYNNKKPTAEIYSREDMLFAAYKLLSLNRSFYSFRLVGGEPTIHPYFHDLVKYLFNSGRNIGILLITNGSRDPKYFRELLAGVPAGSMDINLSIHFEYMKSEHIQNVIRTITEARQHATVRFMYNPSERESARRFHEDLVSLRREIPFVARVRALRAPPDHVLLDPRYNEEDFEWMTRADSSFANAELDGPPDMPMPDWGMPHHELIDNRKIEVEHNQAMRDSLMNFNGFYCCLGMNLIRIEKDFSWSGAVCKLAPRFRGDITQGEFNNKELCDPIKCTLPNCGCDANFVVPKFRHENDALDHIARYEDECEKNEEMHHLSPLIHPSKWISIHPVEIGKPQSKSADSLNEVVDDEPLLSVIVPVYGTEKYLRKCLDSILAQTYRNIEIIVVDDASPGNIDSIEKDYPQVTFIHHIKNRGLFHSRKTGFLHSHGQYIAYVDGDDAVTIDWFRTLVHKAIQTDSDMVLGDFLFERENKSLFYPWQSHLRRTDIDLTGDEIANTFFRQNGMDFSWHVVWNKVYSRELFSRIHDLLSDVDENVISEDVVYSCMSYTLAEHVTNTHHAHYLYNKTSVGATTDHSYENIEKHIFKIKTAFFHIERIFSNRKIDRFSRNLALWKDRLLKSWWDIAFSNLKGKRLEEMKGRFDALGVQSNIGIDECSKPIFTKPIPCDCTQYDTLKKNIIESDFVSFDLFDTLVVRPFLAPTDLFFILEHRVNKLLNPSYPINFSAIRMKAEGIARKRMLVENAWCQEVTLEEIYDEIRRMTTISRGFLENIMKIEIELELQYCRKRKTGYELYVLARYLKKGIVISTDNYLPVDVISQILKNCGYENYDRLFVSSSLRISKKTGDMYRHIKKEFQLKTFLHIGDNFKVDVEKAREVGVNGWHLPSATSIFFHKNKSVSSGDFLNRLYVKRSEIFDRKAALHFPGIRAMLGVIAHELFDYPYVSYVKNSDFNAEPNIIGYFPFGMAVFSIAHKLLSESEKYDTIHFCARDGKIVKRAFETINKTMLRPVKTNYFHTSRIALLPLMFLEPLELCSMLGDTVRLGNITPRILTQYLLPVSEKPYGECLMEMQRRKILVDAKFADSGMLEKYLKIFSNVLFSREKALNFRKCMRKYFLDIFHGRNAIFDIGYSFRNEILLKRNLGLDIVAGFSLHSNNPVSIVNADLSGIVPFNFFPLSPCIKGVVREFMFSSLEPRCIGYEVQENTVSPIFSSDVFVSYIQQHFTESLERSTLKFVSDMCEIFGKDIHALKYRDIDALIPFELFLSDPKEEDQFFFQFIPADDELMYEDGVSLKSIWDLQKSYFSAVKSHGEQKRSNPIEKIIVDVANTQKTSTIDERYYSSSRLRKGMALLFLQPGRLRELIESSSTSVMPLFFAKLLPRRSDYQKQMTYEQAYGELSWPRKLLTLLFLDKKRIFQ